MKVGVYVGGANPEAGGGFTIVNEIATALAHRGPATRHSFTILTVGDKTEGRSSYRGLEILSLTEAYFARPLAERIWSRVAREVDRLLGRRSPPSGDVPPRPAIDDLLTREKFDIIWYLSAWECCTLEIPFITVVWDLQHRRQPFFPEISDDGKWAYRERWMSTVLGRAAMIVAGTEVGRDEIERFYGVPRDRIRLLPHPTPAFAGDAKGEARPRAIAGDYLFYPAQFWSHKNHVNLLRALRILRERYAFDLSLALTGSDQGNLPFVRETAHQLGLAEHVHFLGFVSTEELASLYRHATALVYVTFFGPENLPPLEAFAAGCPVVASDVAGAREQLGAAALLVDPRDPEEIAAAVVRLRDEPTLRERLVRAGADRATKSTGADFVSGVETWLDEFEGIRSCWPPGVYGAAKGRYP